VAARPHHGSENLTPIKPGEVLNPTGINQFTYKRDAEKNLNAWCKEHGRELVEKICDEAKRGKPWAAKLMLDRILPTVQKHEVSVPEKPRSIDFLPTEADQAELEAALDAGKVLH